MHVATAFVMFIRILYVNVQDMIVYLATMNATSSIPVQGSRQMNSTSTL